MSGFHLHFSFQKIEFYVALMQTKFKNYFYDCMKKFGESYPVQQPRFWNRLENKNKFCRDEHMPYDQIFTTKKRPNDETRYTALNYAFGRFKTIESRILPSFVHADTAVAAFKAHLDCIESYLDANPPQPFNLNKELILDEESIYEDKQLELINSQTNQIEHPPFNLFMVKGLVPAAKYGLKEIEKMNGKPAPAVAPAVPKIKAHFVDIGIIMDKYKTVDVGENVGKPIAKKVVKPAQFAPWEEDELIDNGPIFAANPDNEQF
jgi:hypothetical protein